MEVAELQRDVDEPRTGREAAEEDVERDQQRRQDERVDDKRADAAAVKLLAILFPNRNVDVPCGNTGLAPGGFFFRS